MNKYRVTWQKYPYCNNAVQVILIETDTEINAEKIARDAIERRTGIVEFGIHDIDPYVAPPPGRVITS